jgi:hypothetical protein
MTADQGVTADRGITEKETRAYTDSLTVGRGVYIEENGEIVVAAFLTRRKKNGTPSKELVIIADRTKQVYEVKRGKKAQVFDRTDSSSNFGQFPIFISGSLLGVEIENLFISAMKLGEGPNTTVEIEVPRAPGRTIEPRAEVERRNLRSKVEKQYQDLQLAQATL